MSNNRLNCTRMQQYDYKLRPIFFSSNPNRMLKASIHSTVLESYSLHLYVENTRYMGLVDFESKPNKATYGTSKCEIRCAF